MNIKKITVLLTDATDIVQVETDMPCPYVPEFLPSQPPLVLEFRTTYDKGVQYVKDNFDVEPEVINVRQK